MQQTTQKGLSDFSLKYIAAVLMVLDHIHYFFEFTGKIPFLFTCLGRLAAPLFLFCLIEGFYHTGNRRKYFMKIYFIAIGMGLIQFSFYNIGAGLVRGDGFFPQNQMLASFSILLTVLQGIEWCKEKKWGRGLAAIVIPILLPYAALIAFSFAAGMPVVLFGLNLLAFTVLPLHMMIADGGTAVLIGGIVLYAFRKKRPVQVAAFGIFIILWDVVRVIVSVPGVSAADFFTQAIEWMEIFALPLMLCYNGTRGNGSKRFFYWFYPAHIYILYGLSCLVYNLIG